MTEQLLLGLISVILFGIGAQWIAWRFKMPAILLLLLAGIVAGPITGVLNPDELMGEALTPFVSLSVGIILFEGGLSLKFSELRNIGGTVIKLVSIGVVVTCIIASFTAYYLFGLGLELSVLLGAILVVTGPTVVIPLLRQVRPTAQLSSLLKWEGIVIDPIGALLAVLVFEVIFTTGFTEATGLAVASILKTIFFGTLLGLAGAGLIYILIKRYMLPDFLQNPVALMLVLVVFGLSHILQHESGLWATTVMGIALANQKSARIHHIVEFKENLRVLLLSALFILLAARIEPENLVNSLNWKIAVFLAVLILVARPLSVYLSTIGSNLNIREKLFVSWMAPRGVVAASISSLFAIELVNFGYTQAFQLVPIVFIVIIVTVAIYGLTAGPVSRLLKVAKPEPAGFLILGAHKWSRKLASVLQDSGINVKVADTNRHNINEAKKLNLDTYYGNILAEYAISEIDLTGVGKLLALTHNDEVNALSVIHFTDLFGSSNVYQLPAISQPNRKESEIPESLSGRILYDEQLNYDTISEIVSEGGEFEMKNIEEDMNLEKITGQFGEKFFPLFAIKNKYAIPYTVDNAPKLEPGDTLIYLTNPLEKKPSLSDLQSGEKSEA
ncbi:MAG: cation:proton antiporter [Balneolaceae bacterium]|nr:cation:proton antiporter [Balneolaceae bacterium]